MATRGRRRWRLWVSLAALTAAAAIVVVVLVPASRVPSEPAAVSSRLAVPPLQPAQQQKGIDRLGPLIAETTAGPVPGDKPAPESVPATNPEAIEEEPRPAPAPPAASPAVPPVPTVAALPPVEPALRHNAHPVPPSGGQPMIAIVIDDMGLDRKRSAEVVALPGPLTLSFMSYAEDLAKQTAAARAEGDEIMLHMPMEPQARHVDPGPNALLTSLDESEIRRRVIWDLGRIEGIVGVNNHMGSKFTESVPGMKIVLEQLHARGLFFLDSRTTPYSVGLATARAMGIPSVGRDIFLDNFMTDPEVARELAETEAVARRNGVAIAIGHPHDATIAELRRWLPTVAGKGFRLVPVSAVVARAQVPANQPLKTGG